MPQLLGHFVRYTGSHALHGVDLELQQALYVVGRHRRVAFSEATIDLCDERVVERETLQVSVEGEGSSAEVAFLPEGESRFAVLDEGAPEGDGVVELQTDIFKGCAADEAAEDGGTGEEGAFAVGADRRGGGVGVDEVGLDVGEEGVEGVEGAEFPEFFEEEVEDCAADDGGGTVDRCCFDGVEGEDEGGVGFRGDEVLDDEGEDGDDGLVGEAGLGVELNEGEEGDFAGCW